jgi:putative membrane protein
MHSSRMLAGVLIVAAALAGSATGARTSDSVSPLDEQFLKTEANGNAFEVIAGNVALKHSTDPVVRAAAARMVRDHGRAEKQVLAIARQLHLSVAPEPSPTQMWEINQVGKQWGWEFDESYTDLERGDHVMDVQDAGDEASYGSNPQIKGYAKRWLPVLRSHLKQFKHAHDVVMQMKP